MDSKKHPIFSNRVLMNNLKQYFKKSQWDSLICALRNPLNEDFDLCYWCQTTNVVTIGSHYNDDYGDDCVTESS